MCRTERFFAFCFPVLLLYSCGNGSAPQPEVKTAGQTLYEANCTSCHGADGMLGTLGAKDLSASTFSREEAEEIITSGKGTMTPFGAMLKAEEISAIAGYIQTLKK